MYNVIGMYKIKKKGFTIIELLVAVGVMAVMSAGIVAAIGQGPRMRSRDARRKADLESIRTALEMYRNNYGWYPSPANYDCIGALPCFSPTYISNIPTDPKTPIMKYPYSQPSGSRSYSLCSDGMEKEADLCLKNP